MLKNFVRSLIRPRCQRLLFTLLLFMVSYLSLKPGSSVQEEFWLPSSWGLLLDIYDGWKNALGFGALGFAAFLGWPAGWGRAGWSSRTRKILVGACGVMLIASFEVLQFFMPGRHCDPADIIAGGAGITLAYGAAALLQRVIRDPLATDMIRYEKVSGTQI